MIRYLIVIALVAAGCGEKQEKKADAPAVQPPAVHPAVAKLTLTTDPGDAMPVVDAKKTAARDEVVVVGRIDNIVKGFATFNIVDESLDYCNSGDDPMENCPTPWDYCCTNPDHKSAGTMTIEARGDDGAVLKSTLPGLRLLDLIVVRGKLVKDEHGNVTVRATGWFRRDRPELKGELRWPE
ncbi:MAG: hypothetical protein OER88_10295 [Planctomycetota bacterium]|nr:hypothetical protein [Planctomycetota bacterium]